MYFNSDCSLFIEDSTLRSEAEPLNPIEDLAPVDLWDECLRTVMEGCSSQSSPNETLPVPPENSQKRENETFMTHFTGMGISSGSTRCNDSDDELESVRPRNPRLVRVGGIYKSTYNDSFFENMSGGAFCNCYASECQRKWKDQACTCGEDDQGMLF